MLLTSYAQSISGEVVKNKDREKDFLELGGWAGTLLQGEYSQGGFLMGRKSAEQKRIEAKRAGNRNRQASYYARQKAKGKRQWKTWVSPAQEKIFRAVAVLVASEEGAKVAREVLLEVVKRLREKTEE